MKKIKLLLLFLFFIISPARAEILNDVKSTKSIDLNFFSEFIIDFSNEMPFFYGLFTIMFAIILGVAAAFMRKFVSNLKIKLLIKAK